MSTKLYSGLRLTEHAPDLQTVTRIVSRRMGEVFRELSLPIVAKYVARIVDSEELRSREMKGHLNSYLVYMARQLWIDEQSQQDTATVWHDPLRFSMSFGEVSDEAGTRRLAYHFAGDRAYEKALHELQFNNQPIFTDYHYQDQVERPEGISKNEWAQRSKDWDALLHSEDQETDGTFSHLPMWQLPDTIAGVFRAVTLGYEEVDLNDFTSVGYRLRKMLSTAVSKELPLPEGFRVSDVVDRARSIEHALDAYLDTEQGRSMPRPPALPSELDTRVSQLPPVYTPPVQDVVAITRLLAGRESAQPSSDCWSG